jgi:hypothetical protein
VRPDQNYRNDVKWSRDEDRVLAWLAPSPTSINRSHHAKVALRKTAKTGEGTRVGAINRVLNKLGTSKLGLSSTAFDKMHPQKD